MTDALHHVDRLGRLDVEDRREATIGDDDSLGAPLGDEFDDGIENFRIGRGRADHGAGHIRFNEHRLIGLDEVHSARQLNRFANRFFKVRAAGNSHVDRPHRRRLVVAKGQLRQDEPARQSRDHRCTARLTKEVPTMTTFVYHEGPQVKELCWWLAGCSR